MSATTLGRYQPGTAEWHEARRDGLGGSEIAAVLGLSPFESRFSLWHRKRGLVGNIEDNDVMYWGRALEAVIAAEYEKRQPAPFAAVDTGHLYRNDARPWQLAQPDAVCHTSSVAPRTERHLLEVKTARYDDEWGEPGTGEIPVYYRAQCLWYLDCLDVDRCDVAVLIAGSDYREYVVTRQDVDAADDIVTMRAAAEQFVESLRRGERPDIDAHSATYQVVRAMHPGIDPTTVDLPADVATSYLGALAASADAEAAKRHATARVADLMGSAQRARWDGRVIATRRAKGDGLPYVQAANGAAQLDRTAA